MRTHASYYYRLYFVMQCCSTCLPVRNSVLNVGSGAEELFRLVRPFAIKIFHLSLLMVQDE